MHSVFTRLLAILGGLAVAPAFAIFQNGGFESGNFTGWTTGAGINNGLTGAQPFSGASVSLRSGGTFRGAVVTGGPDPAGAPIALPRTGANTARVNNQATGGIANFISQADVITNADRDSTDNRLHVRFSYAVVLENPSHLASQQPFFFIRVRNVTKNTTLFEDFSFAGQTGTLFQTVPTNPDFKYLDWKNADILVPDADVGDSIEVYLLASDCSPSAHFGYAYLDGFGAAVVAPGPGPAVIVPAVQVPTLSEWSLIILGLLLLGAATYSTKRRT